MGLMPIFMDFALFPDYSIYITLSDIQNLLNLPLRQLRYVHIFVSKADRCLYLTG